jgi:TolB-like protein
MRLSMRLGLLLTALLASAVAAADSRPQLAVLDFEARNVDPLLAQSLTEAAAGALRELRVFKVISQGEIRQLLAVERQRELLAATCDDSSCVGQIGNAVGARYVVVGQVIRLEKDKGPLTLRVRLFDMRRAEVQSDETRPNLLDAKAALEAAPAVALASVRPILDKEQGFMELACRENGAKVSIDGRLVGLTPFPMQRLGWGPHRVVVEKEGFIAWAKDVQVERNQATAETVALIPSPEFIDSYRSKQRGLRAGAWITTALAVVGAGVALGVQYGYVEPKFNDEFAPLQKGILSDQATLAAACAKADGGKGRPLSGTGETCYDYAQKLAKQGDSAQWGARAAAIGAVVATGLAVFFWADGEDPSRYDAYRDLNATPAPGAAPAPAKAPAPAPAPAVSSPRAAIVPLNGGAMASFGFRF